MSTAPSPTPGDRASANFEEIRRRWVFDGRPTCDHTHSVTLWTDPDHAESVGCVLCGLIWAMGSPTPPVKGTGTPVWQVAIERLTTGVDKDNPAHESLLIEAMLQRTIALTAGRRAKCHYCPGREVPVGESGAPSVRSHSEDCPVIALHVAYAAVAKVADRLNGDGRSRWPRG